ncbi:MAG: hypothetical protein A3K45_00825 [Chloroflexi bacterium RIFOXYC12_FULL_59_14]|nr:MAG: hypothetical protein A3K45_00825 [Chloroflexi bacterium RIFOXYC12_FULL_59_14]
MDIRTGILTAAILLVLGALLVARNGLLTLQAARKLTFYRLRQSRIASAWWLFGGALLLVIVSILLPTVGTPLAFQYFPPSPTVAPTLTPSVVPTITLSPTITLTPTITDTPLVSDTPTGTATPFLPLVVEAQFVSVVTPNPDAAISPLVFDTALQNSLPVSPSTLFRNPIPVVYASFSYDKMMPGAQWSAVWYRNGEYVFHESYPWDGGTGGYYYSECTSPAGGWQPGVYTVQIFVGVDFKRAGSFTVEGDAPATLIPSATLSPTAPATATP